MSELQYFILVEGINLYPNIYDTDQLSVIRGSSFLYKEAIEVVSREFAARMKCISSGASSGLFLVPNGEEDINQLVGDIEAELTHPDKHCFHLLTFMAVHAQAADLLQAREKLLAALRLKQLQSLTVQPDRDGTGNDAWNRIPCGLSGSRIAAHHKRKIQGDEKKALSASAFQRWKHGREAKKAYYTELVDDAELKGWPDTFDFADDIEALCKDDCQKLKNKMAVVYLDGNRFSKHQHEFIQRAGCSALEQIALQEQFDTAIQEQRKQFLTETLRYLLPQQWRNTIRLETLLWGGDEMLLVMPAWEGFDFLQRFFAFNWRLPDGEGGADKPLTHAAGIVFCQANTPIRIIQKLARELADRVKEYGNEQGEAIGRRQNGWDYLVLESIDYPTNESLEDYFTERYGDTLGKSRDGLLLPAIRDWSTQREAMDRFLSGKAIARGQLYQIVQAVRNHPDAAGTCAAWAAVCDLRDEAFSNASKQEQAEYRMLEVSEDRETLETLPDKAGEWFGFKKEDFDNPARRAWFWIHLLELWDYLIPRRNDDDNAREGR